MKPTKQFQVGDVVGVRPHGMQRVIQYGNQPVQYGQKAKETGKVLAVGFHKCLVGYKKVQRWHYTSELWSNP